MPTPDELKADGWTPPVTIGGNWCRVSPEGIYETWPRPDRTRYETVLSDGIKALLGKTTTTTAGT
jgi:hypothetical protein